MNDFARPGLGQTELPPVNSDDNGKVLGVNNGAWDKVDAPSGGGLPDTPGTDGTYILQNTVASGTGTVSWASGGGGGDDTVYVKFTYSAGTWSADHTIEQVAAAIDAGKNVLGIYPNSEESVSCAKKASTFGSNYNIAFSFVGYRNVSNSNRLYVDRVLMDSETGTTTGSTYYVALTQ